MAIITDSNGNIFLQFLKITERELEHLSLDAPLTHSLIVVTYQSKYLFILNRRNNIWELPGGVIEAGESIKDCVIRELFEETNQNAQNILFKGLMKFDLQPDFHGPKRIEYGALFSGQLTSLHKFIENDEAKKIILWDGHTDIGHVQEIDKKLIEFA